MTPFPLVLSDIFGHWGQYGIYLLIGIAFGAVLEIAGFGQSTKLAAQFYFKDMTVLKVMFTAIIVAMLLVFWTSALGLLDYNLLFVNPTYWIPGILGGLIMGFGFIIGGFCPGTSLVSAATLKLDGVFFVLGVFTGIFFFGETVGFYEDFWNSTYEGRYTLPEFLHVDTDVVVLGVIVMALVAFFLSELAEQTFGGVKRAEAPKWRYYAAGTLVLGAIGLVAVGQPTTEDRWDMIKDEKQALLDDYAVQIHPAEMLDLVHNNDLKAYLIDVRSEADYNLFHILDAEHVHPQEIPELIPEFLDEPDNTVFVVMSNDEITATEVWKMMVSESVPNVYILGGGVNAWLDTFADTDFKVANIIPDHQEDELAYTFTAALGSRYPMADPNPDVFAAIKFDPKIKLQTKRGPGGGGCG